MSAPDSPPLPLLERFRRAQDELRALSVDDGVDASHAVVRAGVTLEEALVQLPAEPAELGHVLELCLEGLQVIYQRSANNLGPIAAAVVQAVAAAEQALAAGDSRQGGALLEAERVLAAALGRTQTPDVLQDVLQDVVQKEPPAPCQRESEGQPAMEVRIDLSSGDVDPALLGDFITESREYIAEAEASLLALETDPDDAEAINAVFRAFHTIKGTSAFLGLGPISDLAHRAESLLSRARDGEIRCAGGYADLALHAVDLLKELIETVQDALGGKAGVLPDGYADLLRVLEDPEAAGVTGEQADLPDVAPRLGDILVAQGKVDRAIIEAAMANKGDLPLGKALLQSHAASVRDVAAALRTQQRMLRPGQRGEPGEPGERTGNEPDSSVRVRTDLLDQLIELVGELVTAQSMVAQDETVTAGGHHALSSKISHAGKLVRDLQDLTLAMRMVTLKPTFQKLARLVRDVAQKTGKRVEFVTDGEDTELDRNLVDVLNDPLVHMVRNAIDHGIEPPQAREQLGKPPSGVVRLAVYHAGGEVVVELQDDGKGLDRDQIVQKAIAKGLLGADWAAQGRSDGDVFNLLFAPGFSTVDQVTDMSGRGVGMDVVKRSVDALRGRIDVKAEVGKGSTFTIHLPLTLAIIDGQVVKVGGERHIVPTGNAADHVQDRTALTRPN